MDHPPNRAESPNLSAVGTLGPLDTSNLVDPSNLSGLPGNDLFGTFDASVALPENVPTEPDHHLIFANAESFFPDGNTTNYTPPSAFDPTASYLLDGESISQSVLLNDETSPFTTDYIHSDSYSTTSSKAPSPSIITGNGRDLQQAMQVLFNAKSQEGQRSLPRRRSRYLINKQEKQAVPMFIPTSGSFPDPLRRWQESPPEDEPAPLSAIRDAIQDSWSERLANKALRQLSISEASMILGLWTLSKHTGNQDPEPLRRQVVRVV